VSWIDDVALERTNGYYFFDNPFLGADYIAIIESMLGIINLRPGRFVLDLFNGPLYVCSRGVHGIWRPNRSDSCKPGEAGFQDRALYGSLVIGQAEYFMTGSTRIEHALRH
jgi:hypothetical protein